MGETAPIAAQGLAGGVQAYGQVESGRFNAGVNRTNADLADLQARDAIRRGELEAGKVRRATDKMKGTQRAIAAANGVVVDNGSAADLVDETTRTGELDQVTARNNAKLEAWGFRTQANSYRGRAIMDKAEGWQAAGGTIITSGAKMQKDYRASHPKGKG